MTASASHTMVAGIDGCPGGWLVVCWDGAADGAPEARLCRDFAAVLALPHHPGPLAVDIPIGLPERYATGGRTADAAARSRLGGRQSSVFATPARAAVEEREYRRACVVNRGLSDPPRGVSIQCFHLFPKIREVDALLTPQLQARVFEVHPELAFWAMNGGRPLSEAKKLKGRPHAAGLALRERLLAAAGFPLRNLRGAAGFGGAAAADDILDACALAWSARRIRDGEHVCLPVDPPRDARGLRMEINA